MGAHPDKLRRTWPQRLLIGVNVLVVVCALAVAGGISWFNVKLSQVHRVALGGALTGQSSAPGGPENYLLVGTDSATGLPSDDPALVGRQDVTGARSDTIMVLHVDPKAGQAILLSIPRDLWVPIAGSHTTTKINAAIETGGPARLVETIQQNLGIPINHYVEVDFEGFRQLVAAVGGIPVYFDVPVRDRDPITGLAHVGLDIPKPGCYVLNPDQALSYARSRDLQYLDPATGQWVYDPTGDLGRISRQQDFMRQALKRALAEGVRNPLVLNDLLDAAQKAVTIDSQLTWNTLFDLGRRFRSFNPSNLQTVQLPTVPRGDGANLLLDAKAAAPLLAELGGGGAAAPSTEPSTSAPTTAQTAAPPTAPGGSEGPGSMTTTTVPGFVPDRPPPGVTCG